MVHQTEDEVQLASSVEQLMVSGEKPLPESVAEIPEYIYSPTSKSYEIARIIVFEGIEDNELIAGRLGIKPKSVANVRSAVRKVSKEMVDARDRTQGKVRDQGRNDDREPIQGTREAS